MKAKFLLFSIITFGVFTVQGQSKFITTIDKVVQALNSATGTLREVTTQTVDVNSISKARFSGGHTRQAIQIHLPSGTQRWYYRITVMDIKTEYSYPNNESFYYELVNRNQSNQPYAPTTSGVDFFLLGSSGDAASFGETGNNNFKSFQGYDKPNSNSFIGEGSGIIQDNLWIGIRNNNMAEGLKVIVEVVAWGHFR